MERKVIFRDRQEVQAADLNNVSDFGQTSLDNIVKDAIHGSKAYTGCAVSKTATTEVTVDTGRLYSGGKVFRHAAAVSINLLSDLPATTKKYVAVVAYGSEIDTDTQARDFLIDVDQGTTEPDAVAMEKQRYCNISYVVGVEASTPAKPAVDSSQLVIAWVLLDSTGVESIEQVTANELSSLEDHEARIDDLEEWRDLADPRIAAISTDVARLTDAASQTADSANLERLYADMARVKELLELEDNYSDYGADRFLDDAESDTDHVEWLAKIDEGVRFSDDAANEVLLQLFNPVDPSVKIVNNMILPKYTEEKRLEVKPYNGDIAVSQYQYQTHNLVQKHEARTRIRYGENKRVCTNSRWWRSGNYDPATRIFTQGGETWAVENDPHARIERNGLTHWLRVTRVWVDTYEHHYWDYVTTNHAINGSQIAQTLLVPADMWLTSIGLYFTQIDSTGDVTIAICETKYGQPDVSAVIGITTLAQADMKQYPVETVVPFPCTFLEAGKRYAILIITGGDHYVATADGQAYTQGTLFYSTDGAYFQGDLTKDVMFNLWGAKFSQNRTVVELAAMSLSGGITDIDLLADMIVPGSCDLTFEFQYNGVWYSMTDAKSTPLIGLPPLLPFRAVFNGAATVQPGIKFSTSRLRYTRPRLTLLHRSEQITLAAATQSLKVKLRLEGFDDTPHDCTCVIHDITNAANDIAPATTVDEVVDNGDIIRTFTWTAAQLTVAMQDFVIEINASATSALAQFHVAERVHLSF